MNDVNIKDYLKVNTENTTPKTKGSSYSYPSYDYKIILDNASDIIVRRTSGTGIQRDFTVIPSDNLVFIRDVKKGTDKFVINEKQINLFFQNASREFFTKFKNKYWNCEYSSYFATRVLNMKSSSVIREFIKKGINPRDVFGGNPSSGAERYILAQMQKSSSTFLKIVNKFLDTQKPSNVKTQSTESLLINTFGIANKINFNNAAWMLDRLSESNSVFQIPAFKGWGSEPSDIIPNLIEKYKLDFKSLINYLFFDLYMQGINYIDEDIIQIYDDTLNMQTLMYDGKVKDKYPKHLKEAHDKVTLIYNLNQEYFDHKVAVKLHNECKSLEYKDQDYCIITPEDSSELINEGISLHHCVGSYVNKVNKGETSILFLRRAEAPEESLITIEYKDGAIKQVRGLCERLMSEKERKFFDKWTKKFKIKIDGE